MKKIQTIGLVTLWLMASPAFAQNPLPNPDPNNPTPAPTTDGVRRVNVFDSEAAYWVNKGFNDTIFGVNSGSFNEARHEERQSRDDEKIKKLTKKNTVTEIIYQGKVQDQSLTPLKMQGRVVELPH